MHQLILKAEDVNLSFFTAAALSADGMNPQKAAYLAVKDYMQKNPGFSLVGSSDV